MNVSSYNQGVLTRIRETVAAFAAGDMDLDQIQSRLQTNIGLLENDGSGVIDLIRSTEADIEEIRFTRSDDEQRPAVIRRLDELLNALSVMP